jgi:hypothetical protein
MLLLQYKSQPQRADALRVHPRLAHIAGFSPFQTPAVGTFYTLIDRLEDGPTCRRVPIASAPAVHAKAAIGGHCSRKTQRQAAFHVCLGNAPDTELYERQTSSRLGPTPPEKLLPPPRQPQTGGAAMRLLGFSPPC